LSSPWPRAASRDCTPVNTLLASGLLWSVFDDGRYVEVGILKANTGNQVYDVPSDTTLDGWVGVTIWCKRFSVSFGAAELHKTLNTA
jgi:hypothetical protein